MKKLLILFVGLLWASLLLFSWSGPAESTTPTLTHSSERVPR